MEVVEADSLGRLRAENQSWKNRKPRLVLGHPERMSSQLGVDKTDTAREPSAVDAQYKPAGPQDQGCGSGIEYRAKRPIAHMASQSIECQRQPVKRVSIPEFGSSGQQELELDLPKTKKGSEVPIIFIPNSDNVSRRTAQFSRDASRHALLLVHKSSHEGLENTNSDVRTSQFDLVEESKAVISRPSIFSPMEVADKAAKKHITIIRSNPKKELSEMLKKTNRKVVVRSISLRGNKEKKSETEELSSIVGHNRSSSVDNRRPQQFSIKVLSASKEDNIGDEFLLEEPELEEDDKTKFKVVDKQSTAVRKFIGHESPIRRKVLQNQFKDQEFRKEHCEDEYDAGFDLNEVSNKSNCNSARRRLL
jgi:hypothetical protein